MERDCYPVGEYQQPRVMLMRHCRPKMVANERLCMGHYDPDLSPEGIAAAQRIGKTLRSEEITRIVTSTLIRAEKTGQIIGETIGCSVETLDDLREIDMGVWDGLSFREIKARYPEAYKARGASILTYRVPGGESFVDLVKRALLTYENITAESDEGVLVVTHRGWLRSLLLGMKIIDEEGLLNYSIDYGEILTDVGF